MPRTHLATATLAALVASGLALPARAQTQGPACWAATLENADRVVTPAEGGDNAFFTRVGGSPPLGFMVFANTPGMLKLSGFHPGELAVNDPQTGCGNDTFLNTRVWKNPNPLYAYDPVSSNPLDCQTTEADPIGDGTLYSSAITYPRLDDGCYLDKQYKTTDNIVPADAYGIGTWTDSGFGSGLTISNACNTLLNSTDKSNCNKCLSAAPNPGYYIAQANPGQVVFTGNFLHFYGPAFVGALGAWKSTIAGNAKIIWGHGYYDNNLPGPTLGKAPNPSCNKFGSGFNTSNRGSYINDFSNTPPPFGSITKFPLAESIFALGYYLTDAGRFSPGDSTYVRTGTSEWSPNIGSNQDTICAPCQYSALMVITDGSDFDDTAIHPTIAGMNIATPHDFTNLNGACTSDANCGLDAYCNSVFHLCLSKLGNTCTGQPGVSECGASFQCVAGTCQDQWYADDAAAYFAQNDLRHQACYNTAVCDPEKQHMATYIINVGQKGNQALQNVAKQGDGLYIEAATAAGIHQAMQDVVNDILKRSTSYAVASITSVQTRTTTAVFVPRFKPSVLTNWEGHLYRYKLFNEYAAGCTTADTTPIPPATALTADQLSRNPNGDGDCQDIYLVDADGSFIGENSDGDYVKLDTSQPYPWPPTTTPATPVWDAAQKLEANGPAGRTIYTAVDLDGNGELAHPTCTSGVCSNGEQIAFNTANVNSLLDALALGGVNGPFCTNLASELATTFASEADCADILIRWVRGEDVFDENANGSTSDARAMMLGDIFHSSPYLVTPPLSTFFCDNNFSTQCVPTLYDSPVPNASAAYGSYLTTEASRDRFILVGANDGMLHAFQAGSYHTGDDPSTKVVEPAGNVYFDDGTGNELWAFIPPEMLPKLKRMMSGGPHQEFVDGSPMVRDVWVDQNQDGQKQADEFHTVAVTGMHRGGRTYFALDVTNPASPVFLWSAPKFGSPDYLDAGQSWGDSAPLQPPILPVLAKNTTGYTASFSRGGEDVREQWVVFTGGGFDPAGLRGRSINAYDIWSGAPVWRFAARDATTTSDLRAPLGPVAAAVGMVDWFDPNAGATSPSSRVDGYFDTGMVGDLLGNLWTIRTDNPGEDTNGDGLYDNWFAARAYESAKGGTLANKVPVFQMVDATRFYDQGVLRFYVGTGDRSNIRDTNGGLCDLNNLPACLRKGCDVDVSMSKQNVGTASPDWTSSGQWNAPAAASAPLAQAMSASGAPPPLCGLEADVAYTTNIDCSKVASPPSPASGTYTYGLSCPAGYPTASSSCTSETDRPGISSVSFPFAGPTALNHFLSINPFSSTSQPEFDTLADATTYDQNRLGDSSLAQPGLAATGGTFSSLTTPPLNTGYEVVYSSQDERSSDISIPSNGYVYWQTFTPGAITASSNPCQRQASDIGSLYHADWVTGGTTADTGTNVDATGALIYRAQTSNVLVPPPTQIPQTVITPDGQVIQQLTSIAPGVAPTSTPTGVSDLYTPIQVLEVDRKTHDCRHEGKCN